MITKEILFKIFEDLEIGKSSDSLWDNEIVEVYQAIIYKHWIDNLNFAFDVDEVETENDTRWQATVYVNNLWNCSDYNVILDNSLEDNHWEDWDDLADRILLLEDTAQRMREYFE